MYANLFYDTWHEWIHIKIEPEEPFQRNFLAGLLYFPKLTKQLATFRKISKIKNILCVRIDEIRTCWWLNHLSINAIQTLSFAWWLNLQSIYVVAPINSSLIQFTSLASLFPYKPWASLLQGGGYYLSFCLKLYSPNNNSLTPSKCLLLIYCHLEF